MGRGRPPYKGDPVARLLLDLIKPVYPVRKDGSVGPEVERPARRSGRKKKADQPQPPEKPWWEE